MDLIDRIKIGRKYNWFYKKLILGILIPWIPSYQYIWHLDWMDVKAKYYRMARGQRRQIKVFAREKNAGGICYYCLQKVEKLTIDHKTPYIKLETRKQRNDMSNMVLCCEPCNTVKKDTDYDKFIALGVSRIIEKKNDLLRKRRIKKRRKENVHGWI